MTKIVVAPGGGLYMRLPITDSVTSSKTLKLCIIPAAPTSFQIEPREYATFSTHALLSTRAPIEFDVAETARLNNRTAACPLTTGEYDAAMVSIAVGSTGGHWSFTATTRGPAVNKMDFDTSVCPLETIILASPTRKF